MFLKRKKIIHVNANKQKGSMLVLAIFVLVVFLLLGMGLSNIVSKGEETLAYEVIGIRAYAAANTGAESALQVLFPLNLTPTSCTVVNNTSLDLSNTTGLNNCKVKMTCTEFIAAGITYFSVTSTGECPLDQGVFISREVVVEARTL